MSHKYVEVCRTEYTATSSENGLYPDVLRNNTNGRKSQGLHYAPTPTEWQERTVWWMQAAIHSGNNCQHNTWLFWEAGQWRASPTVETNWLIAAIQLSSYPLLLEDSKTNRHLNLRQPLNSEFHFIQASISNTPFNIVIPGRFTAGNDAIPIVEGGWVGDRASLDGSGKSLPHRPAGSESLYLPTIYVVGSKSFRPDQLFKVPEIKQLCYFST